MDLKKQISEMNKELGLSSYVSACQFLYLYCYNYYFNREPLSSVDLKNGVVYRGTYKNTVDAVFEDKAAEDPTIELIHSFWCDDKSDLKIEKLKEIYINMKSLYQETKSGNFLGHTDAKNKLGELLQSGDLEGHILSLKIITNLLPSLKVRNEIDDALSGLSKALNCYCVIEYLDDVEARVMSNEEPYEDVPSWTLELDEPRNALKYGDSVIVNISAKSLQELWNEHGNKGLLSMNLRYHVTGTNVDNKIKGSIKNDPNNFWYLNNGIIIVCDNYTIRGKELKLKNFSIVNGGQTTFNIGKSCFDDDFYISCKVVKTEYESDYQKAKFVSDVAEASNTQKAIKTKDVISNRPEQKILKQQLKEAGVFLEVKRGEKANRKTFPKVYQRANNLELAQSIGSFVYIEPGKVRNGVSKYLQAQSNYDKIFSYQYNDEFLIDIIKVQKAFASYKKSIVEKYENNEEAALKLSLIKNGTAYMFGVLGFVLKLYYNDEFDKMTVSHFSDTASFDSYFKAMCFNHKFIKGTYETFLKDSIQVFNAIFARIYGIYKKYLDNNPELTATNFMKREDGYREIIKEINHEHHYDKERDCVQKIGDFFVQITPEQRHENGRLYLSIIANRKGVTSSDGNNIELTNDEKLRNDLLMYRLTNPKKVPFYSYKLLSDYEIERIVKTKPITPDQLNDIIKNIYVVEKCGGDILGIVAKYL